MQPTSVEKDERNSIRVYKVVFYVCAAIMILVTGYSLAESLREYLDSGRVVIGEVLVDTEFPIQGFAKLVSYLMVASVVGWFCVMKLGGNKTKNVSKTSRSILRMVALAFAVITLYEVIYNFVIWDALITGNAISKQLTNIDSLNIPYPNENTPWSLVFATKMFLAAFIISAHAFYVTSKDEKSDVGQI